MTAAERTRIVTADLLIPASPVNVAVVRQAAAAAAQACGFANERIDDVVLAVGEASANVVVHAYDGAPGMLQLAIDDEADRLHIVVRDWGGGMTPRPDRAGLGLGLPLIGALADAVDLATSGDGTTEIRMCFGVAPGAGARVDLGARPEVPPPDADALESPREPALRLTLEAGRIASPVLVRTVGMFAARTDLPVDRLSGLADILEALVGALRTDRIVVEARVSPASGGLRLEVEGLAPGSVRELLSGARYGELARTLGMSADGVGVRATSDAGETLMLSFEPPAA